MSILPIWTINDDFGRVTRWEFQIFCRNCRSLGAVRDDATTAATAASEVRAEPLTKGPAPEGKELAAEEPATAEPNAQTGVTPAEPNAQTRRDDKGPRTVPETSGPTSGVAHGGGEEGGGVRLMADVESEEDYVMFGRIYTYDECIAGRPPKARPPPMKRPDHWPADTEPDTASNVYWLPDGWGQGIKTTKAGKTLKCYISPEGRRFFHKKDIDKFLQTTLPDTKLKAPLAAPLKAPEPIDIAAAVPGWPTEWDLPRDWRLVYRRLPSSLHRCYVPPDQDEGFLFHRTDVEAWLTGAKKTVNKFAMSLFEAPERPQMSFFDSWRTGSTARAGNWDLWDPLAHQRPVGSSSSSEESDSNGDPLQVEEEELAAEAPLAGPITADTAAGLAVVTASNAAAATTAELSGQTGAAPPAGAPTTAAAAAAAAGTPAATNLETLFYYELDAHLRGMQGHEARQAFWSTLPGKTREAFLRFLAARPAPAAAPAACGV